MNTFIYEIKTKARYEIINIDYLLEDALNKSNQNNGIMTVFCPHTTAGITINENGDPDVKKDMIYGFRQISPERDEYEHFEGNSHAHILSSIVGVSENLIIENKKILLGTWQSLYFCEFDGSRNRKIYIKIS